MAYLIPLILGGAMVLVSVWLLYLVAGRFARAVRYGPPLGGPSEPFEHMPPPAPIVDTPLLRAIATLGIV